MGGVIAVTVVLGLCIDVLVLAAGWSLVVNLEATGSTAIEVLQIGSAFALAALMVWRFRAGALSSGYRELVANLRPAAGLSAKHRPGPSHHAARPAPPDATRRQAPRR